MNKIVLSIVFIVIVFNGYAQNKVTIHPVGSYASYNVKQLSTYGVTSNADLSFGSSTFGTDQTTLIQNILNTASPTTPLYLIWDVAVSDTGLRVKSNTYIFALPNCGAILRDSSNNFLFRNYNYAANSNSFVDSNITIAGGIWNGNGFRGGTGKQLHSSSWKGMTVGFLFSGVKNITLKNITLYNTRTWGMLFLTTQNLLIDGFVIDDGSSATINQDGIDVGGYAKNITIRNGSMQCGDDRITFIPNCFGGSIASEHHEPYTGVDGDQAHLTVDNIYFNGLGQGIAIYCPGGNPINDVVISNISGTAFSYWASMFNAAVGNGYTVTQGSNIIHGVRFENIAVEVSSYRPNAPTGYPLCVLGCSAEDIIFRNVKRTDYTLPNPTFKIYRPYGITAVTVNNLTIDGYNSINSSPAQIPNHIEIADSVTITNLNISNTNVDLGSSTRNTALIRVFGTSVIPSFMAYNNRINSIKYFINNSGNITNANIYGIQHTGQGGSDPTIFTNGTFTKLWLSNWIGVLSTSGTITTLKGDGFL